MHPDLSARRPLRLFHGGLELLASPDLAVGLPCAEEYVHERFVVPFQPCGIPRTPIWDTADVEVATEDSGGEVAVGKKPRFTWGRSFLGMLLPRWI